MNLLVIRVCTKYAKVASYGCDVSVIVDCDVDICLTSVPGDLFVRIIVKFM